MPVKTEPFSGLSYGDDFGADNWNVWMDPNLVTLGATLHIHVESATTTTPASVVNGERWIVPSGATGIWSSHVGKIACAIEGTYTYIPPRAGMRATVSDSGVFLVYDGTDWVDEDDYGTLP